MGAERDSLMHDPSARWFKAENGDRAIAWFDSGNAGIVDVGWMPSGGKLETIKGLRDTIERSTAEVATLIEKVRTLDLGLEAYQNREAACCPEDVPFDEYVATLKQRIKEMESQHDG